MNRIKEFLQKNPELTAEQVLNLWYNLPYELRKVSEYSSIQALINLKDIEVLIAVTKKVLGSDAKPIEEMAK